MLEGTQIGNYRLRRRIGEGGMGAVWLAEHITLGRRAAVKVLHPEFSARPDIVTRFFNEARAATAIADPGIVQIFDFGQQVDGRGYIVMELLDGEPLDRRLAREGALDPRDGLRLMRQVASTLGAAHRSGIVHRDLKPENIFIVRDPEVPGGERPKVLDFGIAKLLGDRAGAKTQTAAVMGTPGFMSPEQCRGAGHVDQRSDVYALGCVLFTVVTGRPPFDAEGMGEVIAMHLREPAPPPSRLRPGIPPDVDQLVLRCLAKDPAQRFPTAAELATAIDVVLGQVLQVSTTTPPVMYSAAAATTLSAAVRPGSTPLAQRSRVGSIVATAGLVAFAAVIAWFMTGGGGGERAATTPVPPTVDRAAPPPSPPPPVPTPPEPRLQVAPIMKNILARFIAWSRGHAGSPCPDVAMLDASSDPWGHPLVITCTDQPGDQMAGVISAGPDGILGTADDIASWYLGPEVAGVVRGARWGAAPHKPVSSVAAAKPRASVIPAKPRASVIPANPQASVTPASPQASVTPASPQASVPPASPQASVTPESPQASVPPASPQASVTPESPQAAKPADVEPPRPAEVGPPAPAEVPTKPARAVQLDDNGIPTER